MAKSWPILRNDHHVPPLSWAFSPLVMRSQIAPKSSATINVPCFSTQGLITNIHGKVFHHIGKLSLPFTTYGPSSKSSNETQVKVVLTLAWGSSLWCPHPSMSTTCMILVQLEKLELVQVLPLSLSYLPHLHTLRLPLLHHRNLQLHPAPLSNQVEEVQFQHFFPRIQVHPKYVGSLLFRGIMFMRNCSIPPKEW